MEGVQAVIFSPHRKEVLLIQRRDIRLWTLPGGRIEKDESQIDALKREVKEETGLHAKNSTFIKTFKIWFWPFAGTTHLYICECESGQLKKNSEAIDLKYFSVNKLPTLILPYIRSRIGTVLKSI